MDRGSLSFTTEWLMMVSISNGPMNQGESFWNPFPMEGLWIRAKLSDLVCMMKLGSGEGQPDSVCSCILPDLAARAEMSLD